MGQWGHVLSSISETMRDPSQFLDRSMATAFLPWLLGQNFEALPVK